jgi:hypothetical protein
LSTPRNFGSGSISGVAHGVRLTFQVRRRHLIFGTYPQQVGEDHANSRSRDTPKPVDLDAAGGIQSSACHGGVAALSVRNNPLLIHQ